MPVLVNESLHQLVHKTPKNPQNQPYPTTEWTYGADAQKMKPLNMLPSLITEQVKQIEGIIIDPYII